MGHCDVASNFRKNPDTERSCFHKNLISALLSPALYSKALANVLSYRWPEHLSMLVFWFSFKSC